MSTTATMSIEAPTGLASPRKRPLPQEDHVVNITTPRKPTDTLEDCNMSTVSSLTALSSHSGTPLVSSGSRRQPSQAPSTSTSVSGDVVGTASAGQTISSAPPAKRRKLTAQEKEQRRIEKEQKRIEKEAEDKERAEQKVQKEEEKRIRDEDRRAKNEEKEAKNREKELEKQRKEEERLKKERSQMRLSNFFTKPSPAKTVPNNACDQGHPSVGLISMQREKEGAEQNLQPSTPPKPILSDYRKTFLPFEPRSHTTLAPITAAPSESMDQTRKLEELDKILSSAQDDVIDLDVPGMKDRFSDYRSDLGRNVFLSMKDIMAQMQGNFSNPIDLTSAQDHILIQTPSELLRSVTMKHLQFHEDVRPPYYGTYTKITSPRELRKVARNPFLRLRWDTDYDYDSEAEWEEPEEGEDLESEGEDDTESLDEPDDMEGFLDDEGAADGTKTKKRLVSGDLEPLSTGLCWVDKDGRLKRSERDEHSVDFKEYRMGFLIDAGQSINPFSTTYWESTPTPSRSTDHQSISHNMPTSDTTMRPPRWPLQARPNSAVNVPPSTLAPLNPPKKAPANPAPKRLLQGDELAEFKKFVQGSTMTKKAIMDALKARFPKTAQAVLRDTLNECAARVGAREADKRWIVV